MSNVRLFLKWECIETYPEVVSFPHIVLSTAMPHCSAETTSKLNVHEQIMSWEIAKQDVQAIGNNEGSI